MREVRRRMLRKNKARSAAVAFGVLIVLSAIAASVGLEHSGAARGSSLRPVAARGGVFRTAATTMSAIANLDPTGENNPYLSYELLAAMQKTLVGFNGASGPAGTKLVPQLATSIPKPTNHGLTYTFHLRSNVMFGPPLHRAVTSHDVAYAFQRLNNGVLLPAYGYYYNGLIKGMTGTAKDSSKRVSGISTPNDRTIVFHLTHRQGDFLLLLSLPAAAPVPGQTGLSVDGAVGLGRDVIEPSNPAACQEPGAGEPGRSQTVGIERRVDVRSSLAVGLVLVDDHDPAIRANGGVTIVPPPIRRGDALGPAEAPERAQAADACAGCLHDGRGVAGVTHPHAVRAD